MKLNDKKFSKIFAEPAKISRTPNRTEISVASYCQFISINLERVDTGHTHVHIFDILIHTR